MQCREIKPKIGDEVVIDDSYNSYCLPKGLRPGTKAKLLAHDYGMMTIECDGTSWEISDRCICYEYEFEVQRRWYPAAHPLVLQQEAAEEALQKLLITQRLERSHGVSC